MIWVEFGHCIRKALDIVRQIQSGVAGKRHLSHVWTVHACVQVQALPCFVADLRLCEQGERVVHLPSDEGLDETRVCRYVSKLPWPLEFALESSPAFDHPTHLVEPLRPDQLCQRQRLLLLRGGGCRWPLWHHDLALNQM